MSEMCRIMEDLRNESYAEGFAEGREEEARIIVRNLREIGFQADRIAELIGFSPETVKQWLTPKAG